MAQAIEKYIRVTQCETIERKRGRRRPENREKEDKKISKEEEKQLKIGWKRVFKLNSMSGAMHMHN